MTFYVQYDEKGFISGTVTSSGSAPDRELQLKFDDPVDTIGKIVVKGVLVDDPSYNAQGTEILI